MSVNEKMTAIADAIRDKTGGSEPLSLDNMAEEIPNVYTAGEEAGRNAEWNEFWDIYQDNGNRTDYSGAFNKQGWDKRLFKPKYDIKPVGSVQSMFSSFGFKKRDYVTDMIEVERTQNITFDFSKGTNFDFAFGTTRITKWRSIDLSNATSTNYIFYNGYDTDCIVENMLNTIEELIVSETTPFGTAHFGYCTGLTKVIFKGVIGKSGLNLSQSNKLTHESLMSIINCLKDYSEDTSGTVYKVTLGSTLLAKLTDEEKQIAEDKGWQLV